MNRYPVSIVARRERRDGNTITIDTNHAAFIVEAADGYGAVGKGLAVARKVYPASEGWKDHHCAYATMDNVITDPDDVVEMKPLPGNG